MFVNAPGVYGSTASLHGGLIGDIERAGLYASQPQCIQGFWIAADREHQIAASLQPVGGGLADAARRARNEGNRLGFQWIRSAVR